MPDNSFIPSCEFSGQSLKCSIDTDIPDVEFAFYIDVNGVRQETFWYSKNNSVEYDCGEQIVHHYQVTFFVRANGENILSETIEERTNWSLCDGIILASKILTNKQSTILEFGSGFGSTLLAKQCTVYSVEHDEKFLSLFPEINYIHAPLSDCQMIEEFGDTEWYDPGAIKSHMPKKCDVIIVDGPPEKVGRSGLLHNLEMFSEDSIWIIDDVLRLKDQLLANYISLKFSLIQYRFWNFSILSKNPIHSEKVQKIRIESEAVMNRISKNYLQTYYPSIS